MHDIDREVKKVLRLAKGERRAHLANMMSVAIVHLAALERAGIDPNGLQGTLKKGLFDQFPEWEGYLRDAKRLIDRIEV